MCGRCIIEHNVNQVNEGEKYEGYARLMATIWLVLWEAREWKDVKFDLIGKHKSVEKSERKSTMDESGETENTRDWVGMLAFRIRKKDGSVKDLA